VLRKGEVSLTDSSAASAPLLTTKSDWRRLHLSGTPGKISGDPEIAAFVDKQLESETFERIAEACKRRFGPARAPGKSAVHRYWQKFHAARVRNVNLHR